MSGIFHSFISSVAQQGIVATIIQYINSGASIVKGYIYSQQIFGGDTLPTAYQPKGLTRLRVGTNKLDPIESYGAINYKRGWEGEIGDIRITKGIRPEFGDTAVNITQLSIEPGNTIALFRVANVNGTLMWGDIMSNNYVSLPPANVPANIFSISTYSNVFGGNSVLKIQNINTDFSVGTAHDGLVITTTSNIWSAWPITIDYWVRATSNLSTKPFQLDNNNPSDPNALFWQHAKTDPTRPSETPGVFVGTGSWYGSSGSLLANNAWSKVAITLQ